MHPKIITVRESTTNQPISEEVLSTLPSNSERDVCSKVKFFILKLSFENYIIVDYNKHVRHCRWISVLFL